jgi:hypothetical protein
MVAPFEDAVTIVRPRLDPTARRREVQLAD